MKLTSNSILQFLIIGLILYFMKDENVVVILPILAGTTYIAYTFTKDIMTSFIMALVLSYTLLILLYKRYESFHGHNNNKKK